MKNFFYIGKLLKLKFISNHGTSGEGTNRVVKEDFCCKLFGLGSCLIEFLMWRIRKMATPVRSFFTLQLSDLFLINKNFMLLVATASPEMSSPSAAAQISFKDPASIIIRAIIELHSDIMFFFILLVWFVFVFLLYIVCFSKESNEFYSNKTAKQSNMWWWWKEPIWAIVVSIILKVLVLFSLIILAIIGEEAAVLLPMEMSVGQSDEIGELPIVQDRETGEVFQPGQSTRIWSSSSVSIAYEGGQYIQTTSSWSLSIVQEPKEPSPIPHLYGEFLRDASGNIIIKECPLTLAEERLLNKPLERPIRLSEYYSWPYYEQLASIGTSSVWTSITGESILSNQLPSYSNITIGHHPSPTYPLSRMWFSPTVEVCQVIDTGPQTEELSAVQREKVVFEREMDRREWEAAQHRVIRARWAAARLAAEQMVAEAQLPDEE